MKNVDWRHIQTKVNIGMADAAAVDLYIEMRRAGMMAGEVFALATEMKKIAKKESVPQYIVR